MYIALKRDFREYPYWKKGTRFYCEDETGYICGMKDEYTKNSYPLRSSLASYLWLVLHEKGLFKKVKEPTQ